MNYDEEREMAWIEYKNQQRREDLHNRYWLADEETVPSTLEDKLSQLKKELDETNSRNK